MTDKITLNNVTTFVNDATAASTITANNGVIVAAINNTLSRDGTQPNTMQANIDMNSNRILNLPLPNSGSEPLRLQDAATLNGGGTITVPSFSAGTNVTITGAAPAVIATVNNPTFITSITTPQVKNSAGIVSIPTSGTVTIPAVTDTLVGKATTDTLTNKTLTSPVISTITNTGTLTLPTSTDTLMGRATTDTLTNKTYNSSAVGNTLQVSGTTVSKGQYPGTTTNDTATSGNFGEYVSASVLIGSAVSLTSATPANVISVSVPAGDWSIGGVVYTTVGGSTVVSSMEVNVNTTSATLPTRGSIGSGSLWNGSATGSNIGLNTGPARFSFSTTTTVFLITSVSFTTSTASAYGFIWARRER